MKQAFRLTAKTLFFALWFLEVCLIILRPAPALVELIRPIGAIGLLLLMLVSVPLVRRASLAVASIAVILGIIIMATGTAHWTDMETGLVRSMLFAAFLPTLHILRASAQSQPRVRLSQRKFARLPAGSRSDGITLGAHAFGAVLNTGSFPVMAAVLNDKADEAERRRFALSALRGMNLAPLWSPFFVAMALASAYLPSVSLIQIMPVGLITAMASLVVSILFFGGSKQRGTGNQPGWVAGVHALAPIAPGLAILGLTVVLIAVSTPLSSLETIILIVPPLCLALCRFERSAVKRIWQTATGRMATSYDDLLIVVAAITLATLAGHIEVTADVIRDVVSSIPAPLAILALILTSFLPSMIGIHPMIPTAILLAALTGGPQPLHDVILMGVALTGWSVGTMCSVSSMSVVVCAGLFRVPAWRLMISPNLLFAAAVMGIATIVLSALQILLGHFP
ncbi:MAG TPA: hypothetical protein DFI00_13100 [Rhodospirillaceae bacterium]|nr:hypothetical protein [Alphaproteobacteria bacterium]OUT39541.1 MAG: hypothetical protein CBB62_14335 [Micavibrio sp. TMED2]HCI48224.1 hypothetical protein [Rhodospirillaceae bacterium]MAS48930.1 hypothetical protein [Alphaproteobacteria bacterium]MAX97468.1 hypothetical protein [Alphaproteobacteria bacterium]